MKFYSYNKIRAMLKSQDKDFINFSGLKILSEAVFAYMLPKCKAPEYQEMLLIFENIGEFNNRYGSAEPEQQYVRFLKSTQDQDYVECLNDYIANNIDRLHDENIYSLYSSRWGNYTNEQKMQILNDEFDRKVGKSYHNTILSEMYNNATELSKEDLNNLWIITMPSGSVEYVATSEKLAKAIVEKMQQNKMDYGYAKLTEDNDKNEPNQ
jgi:hypothetical protein